MKFDIERWIPTDLEQSLMDGSFDKAMVYGAESTDINADFMGEAYRCY